VTETAPATEEDPQTGNRVPIERFRTVTEERRKAQEEAKRLSEENALMREALQRLADPVQEKKEDTGPTIKDLRKQYHSALLEGDMEKAEDISDIMDGMRRQEIEKEVLSRAVSEARSTTQAQQEQARFTQTLNNVLADFPQFAEDAPEYNHELTMEALDVAKGFLASGMDQTNAMLRAVALTTRAYGVSPASQAAQQAAAAVPPTRPVNMEAKREVARTQPPATHLHGTSGATPAKLDVTTMKFDDFDKLSPEEIAKLKGY
jgi:hypothetical protein